jgi:acyl carrier protein
MMETTAKQDLRAFLSGCLGAAGDTRELSDDSSLFVSGRLDSLTMTKLVMFLEDAFGIDFAEVEFDVDLIDSVNAIETLLDNAKASRRTVAG